MAPQPHQDDLGEFGTFLRTAREQRGLTLQQIAQETKIPWRHLDALEHGNLAAVPGGMYRRAEIRAFAGAVGLDPRAALERLERAMNASAAEPRPEAPPARGRRALVAWAIVVLAGAAAYGLVARAGRAPARTGIPPGGAAASESITGPGDAQPAPHALDEQGTAATPPASPASPQADPAQLPLTSAEAPAGFDGSLVVTTDPPGARVTVNGVGWGTAPVTIRHLPPGEKRIRVVKAGYVGAEEVVRLAPGRDANTLHITLRPAIADPVTPVPAGGSHSPEQP